MTGEREIRLFAAQLKALKDDYAAFSGLTFDLAKAEEAFRKASEEKLQTPDGPWIAVGGAHASAKAKSQKIERIRSIFTGETSISRYRAAKVS